MAKIIAAVNQKGGVGKTTTTMLLAGAMAERGLRVLVVDADPQATATQWSTASDGAEFPAAVVNLSAAGAKLHREIKKHVDNYDVIYVDCPPSVDVQSQSALLVADLALVPIPPSPAALWGSMGIKLLIERAQAINEALIARALLNMTGHTVLGREVEAAIQDLGIPLLGNRLRRLTAYEEASALGCTVGALGFSAKSAAADLDAVAVELMNELEVAFA